MTTQQRKKELDKLSQILDACFDLGDGVTIRAAKQRMTNLRKTLDGYDPTLTVRAVADDHNLCLED